MLKKKETALKQIFDKYQNQIDSNTNNSSLNKNNILNETPRDSKQIPSFTQSQMKGSLPPNNNNTINNEVVKLRHIRNKNLEQMLKKLNMEQNNNINIFESTSTQKHSQNHPNNNSILGINQSFRSQANNEMSRGYNIHHQNDNSIYSISNRSEIIKSDYDNPNSILSLLRKSKNVNNNIKRSKDNNNKHPYNKNTNENNPTKLFQNTTDVNVNLNQNSVSSPLLNAHFDYDHNNINANNNTYDYLNTSKETSNIVKDVDYKIKQLKLKFLSDMHFDIVKLTKYPQTLVKLYSFLQSEDIYNIYQSCKIFHLHLRNYLHINIYKSILTPFHEVYRNKFTLEKTKLVFNHTQTNFNIYLLLKCSIILPSQYDNCTIEIENIYSYLHQQQQNAPTQLRNNYRFDYKGSSYNDSTIWWVIKEKTFFNYDSHGFKGYTMPIIPFKYNDSFILSITLLSNCGMIDFDSFTWKKIKYSKNNNIDFINHQYVQDRKGHIKQLCEYDLSRFCEMELIKTKWISFMKFPSGLNEFAHITQEVRNFCNKLTGFFQVDKIEYDDVGFFILKVYTKANRIGTIMENDIGIEIKIVNYNMKCVNELKKNGLISDIGRGMQIRIGDIVVFYITLNKYDNEHQ